MIVKVPKQLNELGAITDGWKAFWAFMLLLGLNTGVSVYLVETHSHKGSVSREEFRNLQEQVHDLNEAMMRHNRRYGE